MSSPTPLYKGKAKDLYATEKADALLMKFRDDTSAFDGQKVEQLPQKGATNNAINAFIMQYLSQKGIAVHFIEKISPTESLVRPLKMIPVECVVRNVAAGSLTRRLGVPMGQALSPVVIETFLKDDALHDPMINDSHIQTLGYTDAQTLANMKAITLEVNEHLTDLFDKANLRLVDFKLEFGYHGDTLMLGDEISPDGCRIWDKTTDKVLDKDRFRRDMGEVIESYQEIATRLGIDLSA